MNTPITAGTLIHKLRPQLVGIEPRTVAIALCNLLSKAMRELSDDDARMLLRDLQTSMQLAHELRAMHLTESPVLLHCSAPVGATPSATDQSPQCATSSPDTDAPSMD